MYKLSISLEGRVEMVVLNQSLKSPGFSWHSKSNTSILDLTCNEIF